MDHPSDNPEFKEGDEEPGEFNYPPRPDDEDEEEKRDALSELMEEVEEFLDEEDLHNVVQPIEQKRGSFLYCKSAFGLIPGKLRCSCRAGHSSRRFATYLRLLP